MSGDGFVDIVAPAAKAPCTVTCAEMGKQKTRRVSLSFRLDGLDPDIALILENGPKFNVAFNPESATLRIIAADKGRYETSKAPLSKGRVLLMRFPLPKGMEFCKERASVEIDANPEHKALLIDLPEQFRTSKLKAAPAPASVAKLAPTDLPPAVAFRLPRMPVDVSGGLMGDPEPGRSALDARRK
jgi:hypothetical protein